MGNSLGGKKRRSAKIMKIDGTTFRLKPPVQAKDVLHDHPGCDLLEADDVKKLGLRASPLLPEAYLQKGKLYFLIELPKPPPQENKGVPRRAWSGALHVSSGAKERLESLKLSRRSHSDLSVSGLSSSVSGLRSTARVLLEQGEDGGGGGGGVRVTMRLPKAEVARVMGESKDEGEAAARIIEMCMAKEQQAEAHEIAPAVTKRKEKRTRFMPMPEEIIA